MKFKRCENLTQAKIKKWFNESYYIDDYKLAHFYRHDKFTYTVLMIEKEFGTPFELYISTATQYATTQMLSSCCVHAKHEVSDLFFNDEMRHF